MYISLILFFLSLSGVIIMLWRELILVRSGRVSALEHHHQFVLDLDKAKTVTLKTTKKTGYVIVFVILKSYLLSSRYLKEKGKTFFKIIKNKLKKENGELETQEKKEVSKYLKTISEYRHRIREMKERIKEEEGIE